MVADLHCSLDEPLNSRQEVRWILQRGSYWLDGGLSNGLSAVSVPFSDGLATSQRANQPAETPRDRDGAAAPPLFVLEREATSQKLLLVRTCQAETLFSAVFLFTFLFVSSPLLSFLPLRCVPDSLQGWLVSHC